MSSDLMLDVGLANELKFAFRRASYEGAEVKRLCEGDILSQVREVLRGHARILPIELSEKQEEQMVRNTITVMPDLTITERIELGKYEWKNHEITSELFPHSFGTVGEWEYNLFHPDCAILSENAKFHMEEDGWIVAEVEHLLAFAAAFPDEQRKFPIIALGSVCEVRTGRNVLGLWGSADGRYLSLNSWGGAWRPDYRFLRVRKIQ